MGYAKEPGGWGRQVEDQPGMPAERTTRRDEAFPRTIDEVTDRQTRKGCHRPDRAQPARH